jgi:hypothetical protein
MHQVAARIAKFATGGSILAREETIHRLSDRFFREDLGEQQFKNVENLYIFFQAPQTFLLRSSSLKLFQANYILTHEVCEKG